MGGRHQILSSRFRFLSFGLVCVCLSPFSAVAEDTEIDYTCDPRIDYNENSIDLCPKSFIQDGKCDNPNHGGDGGEDCLQQDCIDCNYHCMVFAADCFGCLNAKGCYYCPGDATCQNSDLYRSENKVLSCNVPDDFWLGGRDDPNQLCIAPDSLTQDPLAKANDWAYRIVKVNEVWPDYTGRGIRIRINDDGIDVNNSEFDGKFDRDNSCPNFTPAAFQSHGTRVAGILAGNANNGHCAAGIAYDATLSSCNFFAQGATYNDLAFKVDGFDIAQSSVQLPACDPGNSFQNTQDGEVVDIACPFIIDASDPPAFYNPCDEEACDYTRPLSRQCEENVFQHCRENYRDDPACLDFLDVIIDGTCDYDKLPLVAITTMARGVTEGRNGKGVIYVFSSGNKFYEGEDVNMSRWSNSRYTIIVGAVGKDKLHTDYSTGGAALTVTGPVGDYADVAHLMTSGLGDTCTNSGVGTSFSAPIVSGIIALMLEARPELTWRDVQGILAATSQRINDPKDTSGNMNVAGFWHSNWYGFGIIDAKAAVDAALSWELFTPEYQAIGKSKEENESIQNDGTEFISEITLNSGYGGFAAESTVVLLNLRHPSRGDLEVTLVSPLGTESILHPGKRPESGQPTGDERWQLMTVRNWGEDPTGTWELKIKDLKPDTVDPGAANNFIDWKIVVYGRTPDGNPPVIITPAPTIITTTSPTTTPTTTTSTAPSVASFTAKVEEPSDAPTEAPVDVLEEEATDQPTKTPVEIPTESPTEIPTESPTESPSDAPIPPTTPPTYTPTAKPTRTPASKTLPPYTYIRPTTIIKPADELQEGPITVPARDPIQSVGVFQNPSTAFQDPSAVSRDPSAASRSRTVPVRPGASAQELGANMNRPSFIAPPRTTTRQGMRFQSFGGDELKDLLDTVVEPANNLEIEMTGVDEIPEVLWPHLQIAIQQHITSVVSRIMPTLHFLAEVRLVSVEADEQPENGKARSLRSDDTVQSVTILFDELVQYDNTSEMEGVNAQTLASLAFNDLEDREAFVTKIHKDIDELESLESVSGLSVASTPTETTSDQDPSDATVALSVLGPLVVGMLLLVWRQRR